MEKLRRARTWISVLLASWAAAGCGAADGGFDPGGTRTIERLGRPIQTVERPAPSLPPRPPLQAPVGATEPVAASTGLGKARRAAVRFFSTYLRFLCGRIPAARVSNAAGQLRSALGHGARLITPAERSATPRLLRVTVVPSGPPISSLATATLLQGGRRYQVTATLEPQHGSWAVVEVDG